ncbi:cysteine desulfurase family protein [Erythrobacter litoralis]|uniref:cysteine desulfurase family protein n=1 Tax=Erythrobacter litoralis TaxID=39960 RepID=UPI002434C4D8|nr:cysteine desulfurase family protein [Erythrobacter litoralis]
MIYLDHQASTPMLPEVIDAVCEQFRLGYANPHSEGHAAGWAASEAVEAAREGIAHAIGGMSDEIIFTSGATEANNLALFGGAQKQQGRNKIIVGATEHKSVLAPARELQGSGFDVILAPVDAAGGIDLEVLSDLVDDETLLVSAMLANNEVGTAHPTRRIADICHEVGAILHCDGAQALAWKHIDVEESDIDMLSLSAHKAGGPKGIGALWVRQDLKRDLRPILHGGGQESELRSGTVPVPLCVGFALACELRPDENAVANWRRVTDRLRASLAASFPDARFLGEHGAGHPGNICVRLPGIDAEQLITLLQPQIAISTGSACTSGIREPSHVLRAMGLSVQQCSETLRLSTARDTSITEINEAASIMTREVHRLRAL